MRAQARGSAAVQRSLFDLLDAADAKDTLAAGKVMARAWAEMRDPRARVSAACRFIADAVSSYAAVAGELDRDFALGAPPGDLVNHSLDNSAINLATTMGRTAASLDPVEAAHAISVAYTTMLPDELRARYGIYYTPPALTRRLISMATEAGVDWSTCRVLDPACGGGAFMAPAALRMAQALKGCEPAIVLQNIGTRLQGFEIDPFAAWLSQSFLEIALAGICKSAGRRLPQLVTVCNSLELEPSGPGFDLVIGNPPYGRIGLSPELRRRYHRSLYGHANQYGVFTDLALRWTAPGGVIAYVTPTSFLAGEYFKALRALLAREAPPAAVDFIADRKGVFEDVLQETLLATYRRRGAADGARVHYIIMDMEGATAITEAGDFQPACRSRQALAVAARARACAPDRQALDHAVPAAGLGLQGFDRAFGLESPQGSAARPTGQECLSPDLGGGRCRTRPLRLSGREKEPHALF